MFKRGIPADRLHKAADLLREQEIYEQTSSLDELRLALPQDVLESSRIRAWNGIRADLKDPSGSRRSNMDYGGIVFTKRLAAFLAVIILILGTTLTVNAGIREKVLDLFRTIRTNQIDYNFEDSIETTVTKLPQLNADKHYDGFVAEEIFDAGEFRNEYYLNQLTGDSIVFTCTATNSLAEFGVGGNIETRETVDVHGFEGDLYHTTENVPENTLIWVDTEHNIAFMISTTLSVEDIYDMVDLIYR